MTKIRENGATGGIGVLATFAYDDLGRRVSLTRSNGNVTTYAYDLASRLASLAHDNDDANIGYDLTLDFSYNPAGQIVSRTTSNDAYSFAAVNESTSSTVNGLNQLVTQGGANLTHDLKGNLTSDGQGRTFGYDSQNRLVSSTSGGAAVSLVYDPMGRLYQVDSSTTALQRFLYDGLDRIAEYDSAGNVLRRHVFGPGVDEPLVWYEGSGVSDRHFLHADERGSIVAVSNFWGDGQVTAINAYDEYGVPADPSFFRFGYTGQAWLPEVGLSYYKARVYDPKLPRFLQPDPLGYEDGQNVYVGMHADPVNITDPTGTFGLFGGCPAGSRCLSSNVASSNGADGYLLARLGQDIENALPGITQEGIDQISGCMINPTPACMGETVIGWSENLILASSTFYTSNNNEFGTYFGTNPRRCGRQRVCTDGSNGIYGATEDYQMLLENLGGTLRVVQDLGAGFWGITLPGTMTLSEVPTGVLTLRIYEQFSLFGYTIQDPRAVIDIPPGSFPGQRYFIGVHYYGPGQSDIF